jgi:signal transduction histidine kinase
MQHINIVDFFLLTVLFSVIVVLWVFIVTLIQYVKDKKTFNKHLTK